jgi:aspartyl-tRNA(Asn)/glutamyl-tRNA(Gln) amidotransferase subunit A
MAPLALGTDTGGSIRLPAGWCGIHGFKPTHGALPLDGVWPLAPSLDHFGPMAASAADCALLFEVLGGSAPVALERAPRISDDPLPDLSGAYRALMCTEALAVHRAAGLWPARAGEYTPSVRARLELSETITDDEVAEARAEVDAARVHMNAVFADCDVVRSPVASVPAPRFDEDVDPRDVAAPHVVLQNLLGLPAHALPDGTQLTGPRGADALVLAAAAR